jgi:hypothetical protein
MPDVAAAPGFRGWQDRLRHIATWLTSRNVPQHGRISLQVEFLLLSQTPTDVA